MAQQLTAVNANDHYCSFTLPNEIFQGGLPGEADICKDLESSDSKIKRQALKAAIMAMLGGEAMPRALMQVIRFCINSQDHQLKKLMMLYWEVVPKYSDEAPSSSTPASSSSKTKKKLLPEMILVCNALMNDLNHPNEYVQGSMLRFLCKVKDEEILSPQIGSIKQCLEHTSPYVRKNAALAVFHAHKLFGDSLIPDGPELMERFILVETDMCARRNAFLMLFNQAEDSAIDFLSQEIESVVKFGDGFSLLVLELTRKVCRRDPNQKSRFVRVLFQMLSSPSASVSYEASWTLVSLSSAPTAVRAAAKTYAGLLNSQSDNNIKLIVLEKLEELKGRHTKVLQEILMDILRALSSPNPDICKKVLDVAMDIVTPRNVDEVVAMLKREILKTQETDMEKGTAYRTMLIKAIHACAAKFPDVAGSVIDTLMDFMGGEGALEVVVFVRAIIEQYPNLRESILSTLVSNLSEVSASNVLGVSLWIVGEYSEGNEAIKLAFDEIVANLGDAPYLQEEKKEGGEKKKKKEPTTTTKNVVLADGTYATQTVYNEPGVGGEKDEQLPNLRKFIIKGDVFLGSILASTLTKMCLKCPTHREMKLKSLLCMCGIANMAEAKATSAASSAKEFSSSQNDCQQRITLCCRMLLDPQANKILNDVWLSSGKLTFAELLKDTRDKEAAENKVDEGVTSQADDLIHFRQLRSQAAQVGGVDLDDGGDLLRAAGKSEGGSADFSNKLNHIYQLTGFADPVYAEALVTVNEYDIVLELLVINRTSSTLQNVTVELSTLGDMKIVERPQSRNIGPLDLCTIRANIKVSSTETGHIFGTIVYENSNTGEKGLINLNDIHMDIMDYIKPATCSDEVFRSMWAEFEWENKVAISTSMLNLVEFLDHIVESTNMSCLTEHDRTGASSFLAANLYARSVFGEDALVNLSVEKKNDKDGKLSGYIRIRSKTQGIALSLGDRITSVQRGKVEKDKEKGGEEAAVASQ